MILLRQVFRRVDVVGYAHKVFRRVDVVGYAHAWPRPFARYDNQGTDFHYLAVGLSSAYGDPLVSVEINLGRAK